MNILTRMMDSLIEYEHVPPSNVVVLNTPYAREHALANARQMAVSVEEDREAVHLEEIEALLEELYARRRRLEVEIFDLENERQRLKEKRS